MSVVERLVSQPLRWHQRHQSGDLIARAGVDVDMATEILSPLPFAAGTVLMVVMSSVWLLLTDIPLPPEFTGSQAASSEPSSGGNQ